jgi:hypothetical protein
VRMMHHASTRRSSSARWPPAGRLGGLCASAARRCAHGRLGWARWWWRRWAWARRRGDVVRLTVLSVLVLAPAWATTSRR